MTLCPVPLRTPGPDHTWSQDDIEVVRAALRVYATLSPADRRRALGLCTIIDAGFETVTKDLQP